MLHILLFFFVVSIVDVQAQCASGTFRNARSTLDNVMAYTLDTVPLCSSLTGVSNTWLGACIFFTRARNYYPTSGSPKIGAEGTIFIARLVSGVRVPYFTNIQRIANEPCNDLLLDLCSGYETVPIGTNEDGSAKYKCGINLTNQQFAINGFIHTALSTATMPTVFGRISTPGKRSEDLIASSSPSPTTDQHRTNQQLRQDKFDKWVREWMNTYRNQDRPYWQSWIAPSNNSVGKRDIQQNIIYGDKCNEMCRFQHAGSMNGRNEAAIGWIGTNAGAASGCTPYGWSQLFALWAGNNVGTAFQTSYDPLDTSRPSNVERPLGGVSPGRSRHTIGWLRCSAYQSWTSDQYFGVSEASRITMPNLKICMQETAALNPGDADLAMPPVSEFYRYGPEYSSTACVGRVNEWHNGIYS